MNRRARVALFAVAAAAGAAFLVWGFTGLPDFGHYRGPYGTILNKQAVPQRHATNVVNAIVFDYRGIDTLGEEFILFAAVIGVTLLLRVQRDEREGPPEDAAEGRIGSAGSDAVRVASLALIAPTVVLGMYVVIHGHLTPGGGFQGGVVLAAAPVLLYLGGRYLTFRKVSPVDLLDFGEGIGAAGFVVVALAGLVSGAAFLSNVIPLGMTRSVFSGGTLPVLNLTVGLEVAAGLLFVVFEFLEQTLLVRRR